MKVLVPLPFDVSNLAHGRNLRVVHLLQELQKNCDLACVAPDDRLAASARGVLPGVRVVTAKGGAARATAAGSYWVRRAIGFLGYDERLAAEITTRAPWADVVLGFDLPSVAYLLAAARVRDNTPHEVGHRSRPQIVCDLIDDPWLLWRSYPLSLRWSLTGLKAAGCVRLIRRRVLSEFDALTAVAPRDADGLSRAAGRRVTVVPNGVAATDEIPDTREREPIVVFTGTMHFPPNEAAACFLVRHVWPRVQRRLRERESSNGTRSGSPDHISVQEARLVIVGAEPTARVRRLADHPQVTVTGRVPDVSIWLGRARVAAAPMISGCGMKNKVLEACAAGCPVVTTRLGAANLPTGSAHGIIVADTAEAIAEEVAKLLARPSTAQRVGAAGRAMVREQFSWSSSASRLINVLRGETSVASVASAGGRRRTVRPETLKTDRLEAGPTRVSGRAPSREQVGPGVGVDDERDPDEEALIHVASS